MEPPRLRRQRHTGRASPAAMTRSGGWRCQSRSAYPTQAPPGARRAAATSLGSVLVSFIPVQSRSPADADRLPAQVRDARGRWWTVARSPRKRVRGQPLRGFKSHLHRHPLTRHGGEPVVVAHRSGGLLVSVCVSFAVGLKAAEGPHLGPAWPDSGGAGDRCQQYARFAGRADRRRARLPGPADLPRACRPRLPQRPASHPSAAPLLRIF